MRAVLGRVEVGESEKDLVDDELGFGSREGTTS